VKRTCDGRPVYPADAALPAGAQGWTQCDLGSASYATWLEPEDRPRSQRALRDIEREANALRTIADAEACLRALGIEPGGKLSDMRTRLVIERYARAWPLREAIQ
jgi:hypothetical protein